MGRYRLVSEFLARKVVASLPGALSASTVYFVRVGTGFDIYVTNESGTVVAYTINPPTMATSRLLGRTAVGSGAAQEISVGAGLSLSGGSLACTLTGLADGDKGDITVGSSGASWTIDNDAVSNAKLANMGQATIKGRASGAGTGDPADLTAAQARTILNVADGATANFADATLLARANHTGTQAGSTVTGAYTVAGMTMATARLLGRTTASAGAAEEISVGAGLSLSAGALACTVTGLTDGDKGDITVSSSGAAWTIDNGAVTLAKMANMATASVIGRTTAGTGAPEVITIAALKTALAVTKGDVGLGSVPNIDLSPVAIQCVMDGGGSTITTGVKGDIYVPFGYTVTGWTLLADQSGSIVVDIWADTYANYPPTVTDTITASAKPTISAATKGQSSTLTGWTTSIAGGRSLRINVDSVTSIQRCTLIIHATRTS